MANALIRNPALDNPRIMRVVRFVCAGAAATGANLGVFFVSVRFLGIWYVAASVIAFLAAFAISFVLQKFWTFKDARTARLPHQALRYFCVVSLNTVLNALIVYGMVEYGSIPGILAQAIASLLIAFESFFIYRRYVFVATATEPEYRA